jgi:hypothetical protein
LGEFFAREVLGFLVQRELLSPEWADRLLSWRHTGFNVHSRVRAKTKREAERVGKYMILLMGGLLMGGHFFLWNASPSMRKMAKSAIGTGNRPRRWSGWTTWSSSPE